MNILFILSITVVSFLFTVIFMPTVNHMLNESNCTKSNFKNEMIPVCTGLIFIPVVTMNSFIAMVWLRSNQYKLPLIFLLGTLAMGAAGFIDDMLGNRNDSGLMGHFKALMKGRLTTGAFKALYGGLIALMISYLLSDHVLNILINTAIIALFTNAINLLDLRPGRAIKGFLCGTVILSIISPFSILHILLYGLSSSVIAYMPYDLKAMNMLGDVGSNILGIALGIVFITNPLSTRVVVLVLLMAFHLFTEKYSLTEIIEKNKFLKYFDQIGR